MKKNLFIMVLSLSSGLAAENTSSVLSEKHKYEGTVMEVVAGNIFLCTDEHDTQHYVELWGVLVPSRYLITSSKEKLHDLLEGKKYGFYRKKPNLP